jgi:hypothetical protein
MPKLELDVYIIFSILMLVIFIEYHLRDTSKEVQIVNREVLQQSMQNILKAHDIYVSGDYIYFSFQTIGDSLAHIERYNIVDYTNSKVLISENVIKLKCFNNKFYYWRTILGGTASNKYYSKVYFDGIEQFD